MGEDLWQVSAALCIDPSDEYIVTEGNLIYAEFFGHRTLVINSFKIARDLLDKRGAIYSSRPRLLTMVEL